MKSQVAHRLLGLASRAIQRRPDLVVVAYHDVPDADSLDRHLEILGTDFDLVGLEDIDHERGNRQRPRCLITFDDGDRSVLDVARPLLVARGVQAAAFVAAGFIGTQDPFWWVEVAARLEATGDTRSAATVRELKQLPDDQRLRYLDDLRAATPGVEIGQSHLRPEDLRDLEGDGIAIGNHSLTHPLLDQCPDAKVIAEIRDAHELLTGWLGHEPTAIAYPNGNVDARALAAARDCGYTHGFLFDHRVVYGAIRDPLCISRVRVDVASNRATLRARVSGLHPAIHHALGRT